MSSKCGGLGKGLDLIFMENNSYSPNTHITLKIDELVPNSGQPRFNFDDNSLKELAVSVAKHGIIQPIAVKPIVNGKYKIIAGERRWRASKMAGLTEVPVIIKDIEESEIMELALVENLQREDLSAMEEAKGYQTLMKAYNLTQEQVAKSVGKSRSYITNTLRLLTLPEIVVKNLENKEITAGHARTLLSLNSHKDMERVLKATISQNLSVRQLEQLVKKMNFKDFEQPKTIKTLKRDVFFDKLESDLGEKLKRKIRIVPGKRNKGVIQIEFKGEEDLSEIYNFFFSK